MIDTAPHNPADDALERVRLAALAPLDYDRERHAAARKLEVRVSTLDQEVAALRPKPDSTNGRGVTLPTVVPWDEPVAAADLLAAIANTLHRHVVLSKSAADAVALWVLHTWVFENFQHTPRLAIRSPAKRCGKSTLLDLLHSLSRRPLKADNISAAGMFRTVEALSPCSLLIDEADAFLRDNEELRGIMNSGFEVRGNVIRVMEVHGEQTPMVFRTFAPLAVAAIGKLPDTVEDRAVPVQLQRKAKSETITKLRAPGARSNLADLARMASRWSDDEGPGLSANPDIPDEMGDREGDVSVPLLAIADNAGGEWPHRARVALLDLFVVRSRDESSAEAGTQLLADVRMIFHGKRAGPPESGLFSTTLCEELGKMEERPWPEWTQGRPITPTQLAHALRPFGIRPATIRIGKDTAKGYYPKGFSEAWSRYLPSVTPASPPPSRHAVTSQSGTAEFPESAPVTGGGCDGAQNGKVRRKNQPCDAVTAEVPAGLDNRVLQ